MRWGLNKWITLRNGGAIGESFSETFQITSLFEQLRKPTKDLCRYSKNTRTLAARLVNFRRKKSRKRTFQFGIRSFFLFPKLDSPWHAKFESEELLVCWIIHVTGVTAVGRLHLVSPNPAVGQIFSTFFRHSLTHSYFVKSKTRFFGRILNFSITGLFSQKFSVLRRNRNK